MASQLERTEDDFTSALQRREYAQRKAITDAYEQAALRLLPKWQQARTLLREAQQRGLSGDDLSGYVWNEYRLAKLLGEATATLERLGHDVGVYIAQGLDDAGVLARHSATQTIASTIELAAPKTGSVTVGFSNFPDDELKLLSARLGDGSPIIESIANSFAADATSLFRAGIAGAVAAGENPADAGRRLAKVMGAHAGKTAVLLRTEMLRVYRDTTLSTYQRNRHIVRAWVWRSALQDTTCPMCWAMHGTEHPLDERMATHPACRCRMLPVLRPWGEINPLLSGATQPAPVPQGADLFRKLPVARQRAIMGPKLYREYARGDIELRHVVEQTYSPKWGHGRRQRSTAAIIGGKPKPVVPPRGGPIVVPTPPPRPVPPAPLPPRPLPPPAPIPPRPTTPKPSTLPGPNPKRQIFTPPAPPPPAPKPTPKPRAPRKPKVVPPATVPIVPAAPTGGTTGLKPKGPPVSDRIALDALPKKGINVKRVTDPVTATLANIDRIHGDGTMRGLPVITNTSGKTFGSYGRSYGASGLKPDNITMSTSQFGGRAHPHLTFAHEMGHYIDNEHFAKGPHNYFNVDYQSETPGTSAAMDKWRAAVDQSRAVKQLKQMRADGKGLQFVGGIPVEVPADRTHLAYALTHRELFARSYGQYVGVRSGYAPHLAEIDAERDPTKLYCHKQWADDDFEPIAEAFDELFRDTGWAE